MQKIISNIRAFERQITPRTGTVSRQMPFAIARALTETARDVKGNTERGLPRKLDRPTPFTRRSMFLKPATKRSLTAVVGFKDKTAEYLSRQERGGVRTPKRRALVIPAQRRKNKYGNLARGAVSRMLARPDTFSGKVGATPGIWKRMASGKLQLQALFAPMARYQPRLGFESGAEKTARARFPRRLDRSLARALETAR